MGLKILFILFSLTKNNLVLAQDFKNVTIIFDDKIFTNFLSLFFGTLVSAFLSKPSSIIDYDENEIPIYSAPSVISIFYNRTFDIQYCLLILINTILTHYYFLNKTTLNICKGLQPSVLKNILIILYTLIFISICFSVLQVIHFKKLSKIFNDAKISFIRIQLISFLTCCILPDIISIYMYMSLGSCYLNPNTTYGIPYGKIILILILIKVILAVIFIPLIIIYKIINNNLKKIIFTLLLLILITIGTLSNLYIIFYFLHGEGIISYILLFMSGFIIRNLYSRLFVTNTRCDRSSFIEYNLSDIYTQKKIIQAHMYECPEIKFSHQNLILKHDYYIPLNTRQQ